MTTILDFIKIARIKGVAAYCLISRDGRRIAGNDTHAETFYRDLARMAKEGKQTTEATPIPAPTCFFIRGPQESLGVFPVGQYILGITALPSEPEGRLIAEVQSFLQHIRNQHTVSQKS